MTPNAGLSLRALMTSGMSAVVLGAAVTAPMTGPKPAGAAAPVDFSAFTLSAAVTPIASQIVPTASNPITEAYDAFEPWVAYGFELVDYAMSWVPGLWWIAPGVDLAYFTIEPLVQAGVYSFSYLLFGQFDQIPPAINNGLEEAAQNFIDYGLAWIGSLIPLPPLPPFPPVPPGAAVAAEAASSRVAAAQRAAAAVADTDTAVASATVAQDSGPVDEAAPAGVEAPAEAPAAVETDDQAGAEAALAGRPAGRAARGANTASGPSPAAAAIPAGTKERASAGTGSTDKPARAARSAGRAR